MSRSKDDVSGLHSLGAKPSKQPEHGPDKSILETFPNRYPERCYIISLTFPEFTSLCPVTGQPDFGTIVLEYIPDALCVESKSFKLYMFAYRNHHSFMETIVNDVLSDLCAVLNPAWCRIKGLFAPRGATRIDVFAEYFKTLPQPESEKVLNAVSAWRLETGRNR